MFWAIAAAVLATAALAWALFTAQRLNRLHIRTDSARLRLQAALDQRSALIRALVPDLAEQAEEAAAIEVEGPGIRRRAALEARLSRRLAALGREPEGEPPAAIAEAGARVELAYRFYNEAVADTRALRTRPLIRLLRLGGRAPLPDYFHAPEVGA
ncbi:hypothetical protein [Corynebacterium otitidis]|uniref:Secreted protein n=1 Tax=Corynebacterium otitidis ATCC 51513 TaxID=883169 RepID=K0YUE9_9CORY|nr:hypothetical protein [Corynebacterium otitidis]EJZ83064.1 hypothetical protein HMPREF9719_00013 [Corynebacterium otitidis ATCC 51513]